MKKNFKKLFKKKIYFPLIILIFTYLVFSFGYSFGKEGSFSLFSLMDFRNFDSSKPGDVNLSLFLEAWNKLKDKSVYDIDTKKMMYKAIAGAFSSTGDPYTTFFTPEENKRFREDIQGEFSGVGVEITQKNGLPTVVTPLSGSPAEKAGLKPNDIIIEVDSNKTSEISFNEVINRIRGTLGTKVKIKVVREGSDEQIEFEIVRDKITVKSVEWNYQTESGKNILVVKIRQFGDDTDKLFSQMADDAVSKKLDGMIIDLRNNPGGYLETAIDLASYFIEDGVIVSEKGKNGKAKDYKSRGGSILKDIKTEVLVNNGSASASEIFSGALRDRKGTKLVGEKTFGKGSVQELFNLSDGSAAKVTIAKWFTPNGDQINGEGLKPDIEVKKDDNSKEDNQLKKAIETVLSAK